MILILDDEPWFILSYVETLELEGYSVKVVTNPEEFLALLQENGNIEGVIVDVMFPKDKDLGLNIAEKIRIRKADIPIIILSNRADLSGTGVDKFTKVICKRDTTPLELISVLKEFNLTGK
jgi:CheY-like chemotaxis protein